MHMCVHIIYMYMYMHIIYVSAYGHIFNIRHSYVLLTLMESYPPQQSDIYKIHGGP